MTALIIGLACLFGLLSLLLLAGAVTYLLRRLKRDTYPPEVAEVPDPVDEHQASTVRDQTAAPMTPADEQVLRMFAGAHFGSDAKLTLPSGRVLSSDEANALTSFYAPAYIKEQSNG